MSKTIIVGIVTSVFILSSIFLETITFAQTKSNDLDVSLKLIADKDSYIKGEPVRLRLEITNNGNTSVDFVQHHENRISVAKEGESYKFYDGSPKDCGSYDSQPLKPMQSWSMNMNLFLWNGKKDYSHWVESGRKDMEEHDRQTRVVTEYVFQDATTYNARVSVRFKESEKSTEMVIIAEPAKINIKEPEGEDLEVWKQIEGNSSIALLMQQANNFRGGDDKQKAALFREVEQIIINHPNSTYTKYLKQGATKLKAN